MVMVAVDSGRFYLNAILWVQQARKNTHRWFISKPYKKNKVEKYRDGSEVSKDSYHSPVKKIKTIKNLQTESDRQWTI